MASFNDKIPAEAHQFIGACIGIIFCAWWVDASSEAVALIRLPATIIASIYWICVIGFWLRGKRSTPQEQG